MTQKEAVKLCRQWQRHLRLMDWEVSVEVVRWHQLEEDTRGNCAMTVERKAAQITILNPEDWRPDSPLYDPEQTLVHELLHLHFEPFWRNKKRLEMEQAIEAIAFGLVAARRAQ